MKRPKKSTGWKKELQKIHVLSRRIEDAVVPPVKFYKACQADEKPRIAQAKKAVDCMTLNGDETELPYSFAWLFPDLKKAPTVLGKKLDNNRLSLSIQGPGFTTVYKNNRKCKTIFFRDKSHLGKCSFPLDIKLHIDRGINVIPPTVRILDEGRRELIEEIQE